MNNPLTAIVDVRMIEPAYCKQQLELHLGQVLSDLDASGPVMLVSVDLPTWGVAGPDGLGVCCHWLLQDGRLVTWRHGVQTLLARLRGRDVLVDGFFYQSPV